MSAVSGLVLTALGFAIVQGGIWLFHWLPARRRHMAMRDAAERIGLTFLGRRKLLPAHSDFPIREIDALWPSLITRLKNVAHGTSATGPVWLFDVQYSEDSEGGRAHVSLAAFEFAATALPRFSLRAEGRLEGCLSRLFNKAIEFPAHPEFARRYVVEASDETAVRSLFRAELLDFWQSLKPEDRWCANGGGSWLVVYRRDAMIAPGELGDFLCSAETIAVAIRVAAR